jgi:hypothetical protein
MKTKEEFLKAQLNTDRLTPLQWSGILKAMDGYIESCLELEDDTISYAAENICGTPFSERWIGFVKGAKWVRSLYLNNLNT